MTALDLIDWFRGQLHSARIDFALTSGQACVYYGIQQTTNASYRIAAAMTRDAESSAESSVESTSTGQETTRKFVRLGEVSLAATPDREANDPLYPDAYYEYLEQAFGPEKAAWARLPRPQRREELKKIHEQYNTPDDLDPIPPELGGGVWNP